MQYSSLRKRHVLSAYRAAGFVVSSLGFACGGSEKTVGPEPVNSVSVTIAAASLVVGAKTQATALTRDARGRILTGRSIAWTSSNTQVATVSSTGEVTGLGSGTADIKASSEGKEGAVTVTVTPPPIQTITVAIANPAPYVGETTQANAIAKDEAGTVLTGRPVVWTTNNSEVAAVNDQGIVTAVKVGSATITATSEGKSGSATVTVRANVSEVIVTLPQPGLSIGFSIQASTTLKDASGNTVTDPAVTWSSSNTGVASVSPAGVVTGVGRGDASIIATSNGRSGSATIGVVMIQPRSLSAGESHTCAIATDGDTYCWGIDNRGQLGNGSTSANSTTPVRVAGGIRFAAISAGSNVTYALAENGQLYCWGLCPGTAQIIAPQLWPTAQPAEIVGAGGGISANCLLRVGSTAYCWGENVFGQLGREPRGEDHVQYPEGPVAGSHAFADVATASGEHACALTTGGSAYCWGGGRSGQRGALGAGTGTDHSLVPVAVVGNYVFKDIAVALEHTCAVTTAGQAYCWGDNNLGELGAPTGACPWPISYTDTCSPIPVAVSGGHVFESISVGGHTSCGLTADGEIYCWGAYFGELSISFGGSVKYQSVSVGGFHVCAVSTEGDAYCRNDNVFGQLGNGTNTASSVPTKVVGGIKFRAP
jgi:uncharacterized protein YjdB